MYTNSTCKVLHQEKISKPISVKDGVKQRCVLWPPFFSYHHRYCLRCRKYLAKGIQWRLYSRLNDNKYADYLCLLSHTYRDIQYKVFFLDVTSKKAVLNINVKKKTKEYPSTLLTLKRQIQINQSAWDYQRFLAAKSV